MHDIPLPLDAAIDADHAGLLQRLPSNATKHFPNATILEAVELAAAKNLPALATHTANDYLRTLGGLFRFAVREGQLAKDPSDGLLIHAEKKVSANDRRHPFSESDLKAIFTAPLYTGCKDDESGYHPCWRQRVAFFAS